MKAKRKYYGDRRRGTVKWFNDDKGFGFINDSTDGVDYFVHHTGIAMNGHRCLTKDQCVEFYTEVSAVSGRLHAVGVAPLD